MPYEVTATRKRPQSFEQLAGQEFVAATLEKSLETGRIAHAYLFSGPRGCGKTSTARILAKALNCEKGPAAHPCGSCDSCRSITAGSSLDVIEIDGASNTSVENVRQIKDEVLFPPNSSRYKIYIIDEVHMLSTSAFNALLKTIEEPPHYVVFMFATTEQHKVPATIKSRCQQFTFRLVSPETIVELLAAAAAEIEVEAEAEALLWIARESGGSVRDAYTLFDQVVSFAESKITAALIREKLGLVGQDRMNALFGLFVAGDTAAALGSLEEILRSGVSPEQFTADSIEYCRALLLVKHGITRESLLGAPLSSFDLSITEALSGERIERLLSIFLGSYRSLKDSIDPRYELDLAVAKASHIGSYIQPSELVKAVGTLKRFLEKNPGGAGPASATPASAATPLAAPQSSVSAQRSSIVQTSPAPQSQPAAQTMPAAKPAAPSPEPQPAAAAMPQSARPFSAARLPELKKTIVADIRKNNIMLATTLDKSRAWAVEGNSLSVSVGTRMEYDMLRRFLGIIAEVMAARMGGPVKLEVKLAAANEGEGESAAPGDSPFDPWNGTAGADIQAPGASVRAEPLRPSAAAAAQFQEPARTEAAPAEPGARFPPAPLLSPTEKEAISLVEHLFKGSLAGFSRTAGEQADSRPVIETAPVSQQEE
jgi:DNA polymerase-3 subunit gamma/tau